MLDDTVSAKLRTDAALEHAAQAGAALARPAPAVKPGIGAVRPRKQVELCCSALFCDALHSSGAALALLWHCFGTALALPWHCFGAALALLLHCSDAVLALFWQLLWRCIGTALALIWHCSGTAQALLWCCCWHSWHCSWHCSRRPLPPLQPRPTSLAAWAPLLPGPTPPGPPPGLPWHPALAPAQGTPSGTAKAPPKRCDVLQLTREVPLQDLFQRCAASELHESPLRVQASSDTATNGTVWSMRRGRVVARCSATDLRHVGVTRGLLLARTY